jgi:hypothetical protein
MCSQGCKHWLVSSKVIDGKVIQTCVDCSRQIIQPSTMQGIMDWMRERPKYHSRLHYIEKVYSRYV